MGKSISRKGAKKTRQFFSASLCVLVPLCGMRLSIFSQLLSVVSNGYFLTSPYLPGASRSGAVKLKDSERTRKALSNSISARKRRPP